MTYKLIAMDFDGTLLTDDKKVTAKTSTILKAAGYYIVGATARPLEGAKDVVDIELFNYLILNNGAYIYDVEKNKGRYINSISREIAKEITELVEPACNQIDYCSGTMYYIYKNKKESSLPFLKDIDTLEQVPEDIARMNLFLADQTTAETYKELLSQKYSSINPFVMQDSTSTARWVVINPENLDKKTTLEQLGASIGVELKEMIFFGDGTNDMEVMQAVGCSVAMGNALREVKAVATKITETNNDDGIATFLEKQDIFEKQMQKIKNNTKK